MPASEPAMRHAALPGTATRRRRCIDTGHHRSGQRYGRYGYRRIMAILRDNGWQLGNDRVERIWRRKGLKVPQKQKPRGRLWFNDGSCVRLRPEHRNHGWSYDFVSSSISSFKCFVWCYGRSSWPAICASGWRVHYNTVRPHSSLGYRPSGPQAGWQHRLQSMKKWKANRTFHFPTPPTAAT